MEAHDTRCMLSRLSIESSPHSMHGRARGIILRGPVNRWKAGFYLNWNSAV